MAKKPRRKTPAQIELTRINNIVEMDRDIYLKNVHDYASNTDKDNFLSKLIRYLWPSKKNLVL